MASTIEPAPRAESNSVPRRPGSIGACGPRHVFAIIVDDVDAVCAELNGKGVALPNGPEDRPWDADR